MHGVAVTNKQTKSAEKQMVSVPNNVIQPLKASFLFSGFARPQNAETPENSKLLCEIWRVLSRGDNTALLHVDKTDAGVY
jgi:hypothetical protein